MSEADVEAVIVRHSDEATEQFTNPAHGRLKWRTLLSKGLTASDTMTCGVTVLRPGDWLAPHRHKPAEIYFLLAGRGVVTLGDKEVDAAAGDTIFIPGMMRHGVRQAGDATLRLFYVFAVDAFADVEYLFPGEAGAA